MRINASERFWSKVDTSAEGCWEWRASCYPTGYGAFLYEGRVRHASRVAWLLTNGPIPDDVLVLHHCDNRLCVRPSHLFVGTHADNHADMMAKGRSTKGRHIRVGHMPLGEARWNNRLTEDQVRDIKRRLAAGEARGQLAREYGVSRGAIRSIDVGTAWAWLDAA